MPYDIELIRRKLKEASSGKVNDPDEFKPGKATSSTEPIKYLFYILPPVTAGSKTKSGVAKKDMDQFFVQHGNHWVDKKPYSCPRMANGSECPICQFGFDLLKDEAISKDKDKRASVVKQWMPSQHFCMNIYFPDSKVNPDELRGRVMYLNAPKTIKDICEACLMREDAGSDEDSPDPFGIFYDENAALLFEMQVLKQGESNSYKTSKFRPLPQPIVRNQDGSPNIKAIQAILDKRISLTEKVDDPDHEKIKIIYRKMVDGDDDDASGGFDNDEVAPTTKATNRSAPAGKVDPGEGVATVSSKTKAKPAHDTLAEEAPAPVAQKQQKPPVKQTPPQPTKQTPPPPVDDSDDSDGGDALNNLLSQLSDD